jgi:hypothetical protein
MSVHHNLSINPLIGAVVNGENRAVHSAHKWLSAPIMLRRRTVIDDNSIEVLLYLCRNKARFCEHIVTQYIHATVESSTRAANIVAIFVLVNKKEFHVVSTIKSQLLWIKQKGRGRRNDSNRSLQIHRHSSNSDLVEP